MTTILGHHISLIRPSRPRKPIVFKSDLPVASYNKQSKTIEKNTDKVESVCLRLKNGAIRSINVPSTHLQVALGLVVDLDQVEATGWKLRNGSYLWR